MPEQATDRRAKDVDDPQGSLGEHGRDLPRRPLINADASRLSGEINLLETIIR
jgi:hypothetical protein